MVPTPPSLPPYPWFDVAVIALLVCVNGLFAMSELAIVSARRPRLKAMAKKGRRGGPRPPRRRHRPVRNVRAGDRLGAAAAAEGDGEEGAARRPDRARPRRRS